MRILLIAAFLAVVWSPSQATTVLYKGVDALVVEADGIVVGTVTGVEARAAQDGRIFTLVTFQDLDVIDGQLSQGKLVVRVIGGEAGNEIQQVDGSPQFVVGDRVLVFLQGNGRQIVPFVGWTQGVFRIENRDKGQIVTDYDGNLVLGVRGNAIVKKARFAPAAEIVGAPEGASAVARSPEPAPASAGDGAMPVESAQVQTEEAAQPMSAKNFVAVIHERLKARGRAARTLESADMGGIAATGEAKDVAPEGGAVPSGDSAGASAAPVLPKGQPGRPVADQ